MSLTADQQKMVLDSAVKLANTQVNSRPSRSII